jgi:RNA polymerase sigma-70 factor, ECF subfamily
MSSAATSPSPRTLDPDALGDHVDRLYRAAWALSGHRQDAEDLVQETYARVLARPRLLRHDDDLGYLLRVMRNIFISSLRTKARRPQTAAMPDDFEAVDHRAGLRPVEAVEAREVFAVIAGLPDEFRDALVAVDVAGLSYREAARLLKTKEATITSRLHRARARVAAGMEPAPDGVLEK